jgi:hypothetical protein
MNSLPLKANRKIHVPAWKEGRPIAKIDLLYGRTGRREVDGTGLESYPVAGIWFCYPEGSWIVSWSAGQLVGYLYIKSTIS